MSSRAEQDHVLSTQAEAASSMSMARLRRLLPVLSEVPLPARARRPLASVVTAAQRGATAVVMGRRLLNRGRISPRNTRNRRKERTATAGNFRPEPWHPGGFMMDKRRNHRRGDRSARAGASRSKARDHEASDTTSIVLTGLTVGSHRPEQGRRRTLAKPLIVAVRSGSQRAVGAPHLVVGGSSRDG